VDVQYTDLMADPIAVVRRIYRHFDLPFPAGTEQAMRRYLPQSRQDLHGRHVYSLAQFGLDAETERARYRAYWDGRAPAPA
jgi:hypothetical protein